MKPSGSVRTRRQTPSASPRECWAETTTSPCAPRAVSSARLLPQVLAQSGPTTLDSPNNLAALLRRRSATSTLESPPHIARKWQHVLPALSTPPPCRFRKFALDLYSSHSWSFTAPCH